MSTIGKIIKDSRTKMGYTQEELAAKVGVQKSAIAKWENGRVSEIKRSNLKALAVALELNPNILLSSSDEPEAPAGIAGDEQVLLGFYRELNDEGKEKLVDYADDLCSSGKYKKHCADAVV